MTAGTSGARGREPVEVLERGGPRSKTQRRAIALSVILNLTVLGFFKYFNFGVDSFNALAQSLGLESWQWNTFFRVILPLGISFYTFQAMSYTIDVYRGEAKAMKNFTDFSCFVSMFPHLVAGPILKFSYLADQLESRTLSFEKFARGATFVALGLAKKILLANPAGKVADTTFNAGSVGILGRMVRCRCLCVSDLLRLQRVFGHGDRAWTDARLRLRQEL